MRVPFGPLCTCGCAGEVVVVAQPPAVVRGRAGVARTHRGLTALGWALCVRGRNGRRKGEALPPAYLDRGTGVLRSRNLL